MEISSFNGEGYMPLISYNGWRVALINYCDRLKENKISKIERHLKTDEVFILLQGEANLYIGLNLTKYPMEKGKLYNVKCGEWHCVSMSENAKIAVIENDDTGERNSEYYILEEGIQYV